MEELFGSLALYDLDPFSAPCYDMVHEEIAEKYGIDVLKPNKNNTSYVLYDGLYEDDESIRSRSWYASELL